MTDTTASGLPAATTGRARVLWSDETQPDTSIGSRKATPAQVVAEGAGGAVGAIAAALGGIGGAAALSVGTTAGTVAAGNDARILGAAATSALGGMAYQSPAAISITGGLAPAFSRMWISGVDPAKHLIQLGAAVRATGAGTIAICGDSRPFANAPGVLAGSGPNPPTPLDFVSEMIKRAIALQNPGVNLTFLNDGLPGSTWIDWAGVSTVSVQGWNSPGSANTLSYVQAQAPDLIVIMLGANDSYNFSSIEVYVALGLINSWAKVPDIILVPTEPLSNDPLYGRNATWVQNGFASVASYTRTLAQSGAHIALWGLTRLRQIGLLDFGRMAWITQRGIDYEDQIMTTRVASPVTGMTGAATYFLPYSCDGDFDYSIRFVGQGATLFTNLNNILITFGAIHNNAGTGIASSEFSLITKAAGGGTNWAVQYYSGNGGGGAFGALQSVPAPTSGDIVLRVNCQGGYCQVYAGGFVIYDQAVVRAGGPHTPSIGFNGSGASSVTFQLDSYATGKARTYLTSTTNDAVYNTTLSQGGGDSGAHANDDGLHSMYWSVLDRTDFALSRAVRKLTTYRFGPSTGATVTAPVGSGIALLTPPGTLATLTFVLPANPLDGDTYRLVSSTIITALTLTAAGGATISGQLTSLAAYAGHEWQYIAASGAWIQTL